MEGELLTIDGRGAVALAVAGAWCSGSETVIPGRSPGGWCVEPVGYDEDDDEEDGDAFDDDAEGDEGAAENPDGDDDFLEDDDEDVEEGEGLDDDADDEDDDF